MRHAAAEIAEEVWEELEEILISSDVGVEASLRIVEELKSTAKEDRLETPEQVFNALKELLVRDLNIGEPESEWLASDGKAAPYVILMVGVNGVGKTTTVGKLGWREASAGRSVVFAAGDTFRAAAADQLQVWADRAGATMVRGAEGADPGSVVFDAVEHGAARGADLVLADTAGRVHTRGNLMDELAKVRRVADKGAGTVTETLLVIDATTGQNGLLQAREFAAAADVTGIVLTKLDGSARGGIVVAVHEDLGIPVKLVGVGEDRDDLLAFDPADFVDALFSVDVPA